MVSVEPLGALQRRLNASISQQQVRGEVEARLKRLGRTAKAPGFRPGKVPFKILEQQYGAQVEEEVMGDALQRSFSEAARANNLRVAGYPNFDIKPADPAAADIEYSATFEVYPEIAIGDVSQQPLERVAYALTDADVDATIATLQKQRATYEPVQRAVQGDDQVKIDFAGKMNGVPFEGGEASNFTVVLGQGRMLPDFERGIVGMSVGETRSFDMVFPEDYHGKDVAGKPVTFTITLHAVDAPKLPEINAEFALALGIADGDIGKLRSEIRENLRREVERRIKGLNKNNVMDLLLKVCTLDVPKALLDSEVKSLMQQAMADMQERGIKIPKGMTLPPDMFTERAEKRVKLGLILAELVKLHDLAARPEQVKALIQDYAQSFERPEEVVKWHYSDPSRLHEAESMVLEDNVVAWATGHARVADKAMDFNELMGRSDEA